MTNFKRRQQKHVKKPYRVRNWAEYEAGLRNRGSLTVWLEVDAVRGTIPYALTCLPLIVVLRELATPFSRRI